MYAHIKDGKTTLHNGGGISIGQTQYPGNIFQLWSKAELAEIGLYPVERAELTDEQRRYQDNVFSYSLVGDKVVESVVSTDKPDRAALETAHTTQKAKDDLRQTDNDFVRVAEEIIDLLVAGDTALTGLSVEAKAKIAERKALRGKIPA